MAIVLDCSVAAAWAFQDENSTLADEAVLHVREFGAHVPSLWWWELANVFVLAAKKGRCSVDEARTLISNPVWNHVLLDRSPDVQSMLRTAALARQYSLTVYDAAYLDLALALKCPLATLDRQLARAAREADVPLLLSTAH